ncbi:ZYRO0F00242p [Zygosaccharomyces rouxii]|uniref:ZYRO0F00242p n=2 Tax=Zygosaccharomyces rouxii TaxID=4956 RepID=C5DWW8_ZYGRC|nr:uncharacterized protein ZYRO0F00242g [Zygosaccharomyces rouxii]KAH9199045.1 amino acid/polyamine transporter I [Zygosaccharomyces rouxii]CAR28279.1 ZYRO0F00242p [Zygosaccharomyces rouxii]
MQQSKEKSESKIYDVIDVEEGHLGISHEIRGDQPVRLEKKFNLLSAIASGISTGNTWTALGGAIVASLNNGGPPGIMYEFIAVSVFYWAIGASIAELASSVPASGGVYHWAAMTPGKKWGPICGWFAGWFDFLAWNFGIASNANMVASMIVYSYGLFHPDTELQRWHVYICFLILTWLCCFVVMFADWALPTINRIGSFLILGGWFVTVVVCAVMPSTTGKGHASNDFVWSKWQNNTGYSSDGFAFLLGMLNGAFSVGTPDCITHLAEEIPDAGRNLPKVLFWQILVGFITAITYMIAMFYAINNLPIIFSSNTFSPLGEIYLQATNSRGGAIGLLLIIYLPIICAIVGCYITAGRTLYVLARDNATPFSKYLGAIHPRYKSPFWATFACGVLCTCLGAIYVGSATAFNAFVGSFVLLTTAAFFLAMLPNLLTKRSKLPLGSFNMGKFGYAVNIISCLYILVFFVIYCFPYSLPATAENMNYTSVMVSGLTLMVAIWWMVHGRKNYKGPTFDMVEKDNCSVLTDDYLVASSTGRS